MLHPIAGIWQAPLSLEALQWPVGVARRQGGWVV
jgi:hypothetical protein